MGAKLNLLGQVFGELTVVEELQSKVINGVEKEGVFWRCSCSCGGELIATSGSLRASLKQCSMCRTNNNIRNLVGKVFKSRNYGDYIVTAYKNAKEISIKFLQTGFETTSELKEVKSGAVKDYFLPTVSGVGYLGIGDHECQYVNAFGKKTNTPEYEVWNGMLKRCYNKEWRDKGKHLSYEGATVCKEWHNFQNFAEWYKSMKPQEGFALDKDLKIIGNREYSPQACSFVPPRVNSLFTGTKDDRDLPRGVHMCNTKGKFIVQLHKGDVTAKGNPKQTYLGAYGNKDEAIAVYRKAKIEIVSQVADEYKDVLDPVVYQNLKTRVLEFI